MAFIDECTVQASAGDGGDGCISFRREKYVPFGGPNGGCGGQGGSVYFVASENKSSLVDFAYSPLITAPRGQHGMGKDMDGRGGADKILEVPVGTMVFEKETGVLLGDLNTPQARLCVAQGGKGGIGNMYFATPTRRAPRIATPGQKGEKRTLRLELRLLADVGLCGLPNAGKSSLLRAVSHAKPKVADYPFTTLVPHLGLVSFRDSRFIMADIPGIIEGASEGAGLGHRFLRHLLRQRVLLHLVDGNAPVPTLLKTIEVVERELAAFKMSFLEIPRLLVLTKADCLLPIDRQEKSHALENRGHKPLWISSHSHEGIPELLAALITLLPAHVAPQNVEAAENPISAFARV